jgi:hypothetical protein
MTDNELMALAAKAAGAKWSDYSDQTPDHWQIQHADKVWRRWSPLTDDGDALRLAVALDLTIYRPGSQPSAVVRTDAAFTTFPDDCVRRAIIFAAADIGKSMP